MTSLDRKLLRDLFQMKGQMLAICLVLACGLATFIMSVSVLDSLKSSRDRYYAQYGLADVFVRLKRAPVPVAARLAAIPGVAAVETRVTVGVNLDVEGLKEPGVGVIISLPDYRQPTLNRVHLRAGRMPEPGREGEVLANEAFAEAHGFEPGAKVTAVINGRRETLTIVGIALSPEFVYTLPAGSLFPDDKRYGIFWMRYTQLAAAYDMEGAFNDATFSLSRDAMSAEVIRRVDRVLEPFGGLGAYAREDQLSNRFLSSEIQGLESTGFIIPVIFLSVAAFLLNVVLTRLINTQREQIAVLKAFGYTHREIGIHYLRMVTLVAVVGIVLGTGLGAWLGRGLLRMYAEFYRFPVFDFNVPARTLVMASGVALLSAFLGVFGAIRRAVRLPPAEAMRPPPPPVYRTSLVERIGLQRVLSQASRMILRNIERHPFKASLSVFAVAVATAILVVGNFMADSIDYMMDFQFQLVERQDLTITFIEPRGDRALREVRHMPGVIYTEPFRTVSARFRVGPREELTAITGLPLRSRLTRPVDANERPIVFPPHGLVLSEKLAELLAVKPGDLVTVEALEQTRPVFHVPVSRLLRDYSGTAAYLRLDELNRLMQQGPMISGVQVVADSRQLDDLYVELKEIPLVSGVTVKQAAIRSFYETFAKNLLTMKSINVIFACVIAIGVVYNNARIALSERSRELATLRVLGFTRAEISAILLGELAALTLSAVPLGLVGGYCLAWLVVIGADTDLYRVPMVVSPATYGFAACVIIAAALVSGLIVRRRLDHLDLVAVLKQRE
jgi:putative ABC transport system permease protein